VAAVRNALVVGGGIAGMSVAVSLRKIGVAVDLVEIDPEWKVYGAGITLTAPSLRAFENLGIAERIAAEGNVTHSLKVCDANGLVLSVMPMPGLTGPGTPGNGGIMRPVLHAILSDAVKAEGVTVRLGVTLKTVATDGSATLTDGSHGKYDLVIGADGLHSKVRALVFPDAPKPKMTGQGCWRVVVPRPREVDTGQMFLGKDLKAGITPVSRDEMYLFYLQHVPDNPRMPDHRMHDILAGQLAPFGGLVGDIRRSLGRHSNINYRPLEAILTPLPWYRGRVLLIGDAAHGTTPHLASGAGLAVEDGLVLTELLGTGLPLDHVLDRFMTRRYPRAALVVNNSLRIGELEMNHGSVEEQTKLMAAAMAAIVAPM
jgi:2-polyprenyl-6-methoxyphenol hydroxylase-like FAD-dependent oxidoreductase